MPVIRAVLVVLRSGNRSVVVETRTLGSFQGRYFLPLCRAGAYRRVEVLQEELKRRDWARPKPRRRTGRRPEGSPGLHSRTLGASRRCIAGPLSTAPAVSWPGATRERSPSAVPMVLAVKFWKSLFKGPYPRISAIGCHRLARPDERPPRPLCPAGPAGSIPGGELSGGYVLRACPWDLATAACVQCGSSWA